MNREQQRVIEAAENLVQFLDPASVADQAADPILVTERNWAEHMLCEAVGEMITERARRAEFLRAVETQAETGHE